MGIHGYICNCLSELDYIAARSFESVKRLNKSHCTTSKFIRTMNDGCHDSPAFTSRVHDSTTPRLTMDSSHRGRWVCCFARLPQTRWRINEDIQIHLLLLSACCCAVTDLGGCVAASYPCCNTRAVLFSESASWPVDKLRSMQNSYEKKVRATVCTT